MSDSHSREEVAFDEARRLASPAERVRFLDGAGLDGAARARVEARLSHCDRQQDSDGASDMSVALTVIGSLPAEPPGTMIGPYKLREQIGEGGMGIVYVAEQEHPVRRMVALKVIKPGMDSREVIARFEAERQALALMDHPHIAKVLDAGTVGQAVQPDGHDTGDVDRQSRQAGKTDLRLGRPYFVMELVRGVPITNYCDQAHTELPERLGLFIQVCQAVQHAHQKGIIHRDLKPSNILVTLHDGVPVPKVIDFGVAKAINQRLTEYTIYTRQAQMVGTPLYMSPEQAELSGLDIDTRSDVYSLGVVLYELLTGMTPFDRDKFSKLSFDEMRRVIREEEPSPPSRRISTLGQAQITTLSKQRGLDSRRMGDSLRGDLDWIVMKALEKDRTRRYDSASALAADVERFLADEPVEACPPSALYRMRKFARRRKGLLTSIALLGLAIVVGTGISLWQAVEATRARDDANANLKRVEELLVSEKQARTDADTQRQEVDLQRQQVDVQRQQAEANFRKALAAVDRMLLRIGSESLNDVPQMEGIRRKALEDALEFFEQLLAERPTDRELRLALMRTHDSLWDVYTSFNETELFDRNNRALIKLLEELHAEMPDDRKLRLELSVKLGRECGRIHDLKEREKQARRAVDLLVPIADRSGTDVFLASARRSLGDALQLQHRAAEAKAEYDAAIALCRASRDKGGFMLQVLGDCYRAASQLDERLGRSEAAIAEKREAVETRHQHASNNRRAIAHEHEGRERWELGKLLNGMGRHEEAIASHGEAIEIWNRLMRDYPNHVWYREQLGMTQFDLIAALRNAGKQDEAREVSTRLEETVDVLLAGRQGAGDLTWTLVTTGLRDVCSTGRIVALADKDVANAPNSRPPWLALGLARWRDGNFEGAREALRRSMELSDGGYAYEWFGMAMVEARLGHDAAASDWYCKAVEWMPANSPSRLDLQQLLRESTDVLGDLADLKAKPAVLLTRAQVTADSKRWRRARADYEELLSVFGGDLGLLQQHAFVCLGLGDLTAYRNDCETLLRNYGGSTNVEELYWLLWGCVVVPEAVGDIQAIIALANRAVELENGRPRMKRMLGAALYRGGRFDEALRALQDADSPTAAPTSQALRCCFLSMTCSRLKDSGEARQWLDKSEENSDVWFGERLAIVSLREEAARLLEASADPKP